jgi:hypothetical protein
MAQRCSRFYGRRRSNKEWLVMPLLRFDLFEGRPEAEVRNILDDP